MHLAEGKGLRLSAVCMSLCSSSVLVLVRVRVVVSMQAGHWAERDGCPVVLLSTTSSLLLLPPFERPSSSCMFGQIRSRNVNERKFDDDVLLPEVMKRRTASPTEKSFFNDFAACSGLPANEEHAFLPSVVVHQ